MQSIIAYPVSFQHSTRKVRIGETWESVEILLTQPCLLRLTGPLREDWPFKADSPLLGLEMEMMNV